MLGVIALCIMIMCMLLLAVIAFVGASALPFIIELVMTVVAIKWLVYVIRRKRE